MSKRVLLSVYDKSGLTELGRELVRLGYELVASGGTAGSLRRAGIPVRDVAEITGAPEMLGGRVKTLHPAIHGGILARDNAEDRSDLAALDISPIDLVVCNLYPFAGTVARPGVTLPEAIEEIDIGGVTLLRAAAKNFARVTVVCDPADYDRIIQALASGEVAADLRQSLALKAFRHTRDYDTAVADYLAGLNEQPEAEIMPESLTLSLVKSQSLRYGENPHQAAALYVTSSGTGPLGGQLLQGKELSYNNLLDLDAAWRAAEAYSPPTVTIVKHLSPCGIAIGPDLSAAFEAALASDPVSAFGGVIAANRPVDVKFISAPGVADLFIEAVIAPSFTDEAVAWFAANKKNCRLVTLGDSATAGRMVEWRSIRAGFVAQTRDTGDPTAAEWRVVSRRAPTDQENNALRFA